MSGWRAPENHAEIVRATKRMLRAGKISIEDGDVLTDQQRFLIRYSLGLAYRDLRACDREKDAKTILEGIRADVEARGRST